MTLRKKWNSPSPMIKPEREIYQIKEEVKQEVATDEEDVEHLIYPKRKIKTISDMKKFYRNEIEDEERKF